MGRGEELRADSCPGCKDGEDTPSWTARHLVPLPSTHSPAGAMPGCPSASPFLGVGVGGLVTRTGAEVRPESDFHHPRPSGPQPTYL